MVKLYSLVCVGLGLALVLGGCSTSEDEATPGAMPAWMQTFLDDRAKAFKEKNIKGQVKDHDKNAILYFWDQGVTTYGKKSSAADIEDWFEKDFPEKGADGWSSFKVLKTMGHDKGDDYQASASMVWTCDSCKIPEATETFIFNSEKKVIRHTFVYYHSDKTPVTNADITVGTDQDKPVSKAWENHFSAFGGQNVTKIAKDYDESSIVYVFDHGNGELSTSKGLKEIQDLFKGLFESLPNTADVTAPVQVVEENDGSLPSPLVFLAWKSSGNGYSRATDTFVFSTANPAIIKRQYVVVNYKKPAQFVAVV